MKVLPVLFLFSLFLVSCGTEPKRETLSGESLGKSCKADSDCGYSEKCVGGRCYGI